MDIGKYKQMMAYLTRPNRVFPSKAKQEKLKEPTEADLNKEDLKPSRDIVRNLLIEEMKHRDLDKDEIKYLIQTKPRDNIKTQKISDTGQSILSKSKQPDTEVKPFEQRKKTLKPEPNAREILEDLKINMPTIVEPIVRTQEEIEAEKRFNDMMEKSKQEKERIKNGGLAYLYGGITK